jgi:hypothetical protein
MKHCDRFSKLPSVSSLPIKQNFLMLLNRNVRPIETAIEQWMTIKLLIFLPNKCFSEFG